MSTHKNIDRVCLLAVILSLVLTGVFLNGEALGIQNAARTLGYETRLFDDSRVHTIAIVMDGWEDFIENAQSEEYSPCTVLIDNEAYKNVGIRGKGNTSLTSVSSMDSQRYSFKIEFDHYDGSETYHGLDKLSLNNIIQDNTYMKDFLAYRLMDQFGADAPLCSFAYITVNGEDWGLYLAVEGVEDSFLRRNYGRDSGDLYKPDSSNFGGGGPGNGRHFRFEDFFNEDGTVDTEAIQQEIEEAISSGRFPGGTGDTVDAAEIAQEIGEAMASGTPPQFPGGGFGGGMPGGFPDFNGEAPENPPEDLPEMPDTAPPEDTGTEAGTDGDSGSPEEPSDVEAETRGGGRFNFSGAFGGMGSSDVKLQYIDDDPESYSNIFSNAKTTVTQEDQSRLIAALKNLSEGADLEETVNVDEVLRYFVVHNYVCNGDSYTGSIIHNYYLYEKDGQLSMIPWDYNLAFGTFQSANAQEMVNDPIDTPMSVSDSTDRPMFGWILENAEYLALYHEYFAEFLDAVDVTGLIDRTYAVIAPCVEKDPTAFCTYAEFETAVKALRTFCELRTRSVRGQLDGSIPSTDQGQSQDSASLIDASELNLSDMGSMGGGMGGGPGGENGGGPGRGGMRGGFFGGQGRQRTRQASSNS